MNLTLITGTSAVDNTSAAVAASAVTSPIWLPWLQYASDGAAQIAPLLGAIWLIIQIIAKLREMLRKDKDK